MVIDFFLPCNFETYFKIENANVQTTKLATIIDGADLLFSETTDDRYNTNIKKHISRYEALCNFLFSPLTAKTKQILFTKLLHARRRKF